METGRIREIIENILSAMDISGTVEAIPEKAINGVRFHITTDHATILIGNQGANLTALSHVVRKIVEKQLGEDAKYGFIVDVDNFQGRRIEELREMSVTIADQVRHFKTDMEMDPLPPYERMVIHTLLAEEGDLKTESTGDGKMRRVVVRFVDTKEGV